MNEDEALRWLESLAMQQGARPEELVTKPEERLAQPGPKGGRKLITWASAEDHLRQDLLIQRGYTKGNWPEYQRRRSMELSSLSEALCGSASNMKCPPKTSAAECSSSSVTSEEPWM